MSYRARQRSPLGNVTRPKRACIGLAILCSTRCRPSRPPCTWLRGPVTRPWLSAQ